MRMEERLPSRAPAPTYYILECFTPLDADPADFARFPEVAGLESWMCGSMITISIPEPLELELDPSEPGPIKEMYNLDMLIMSERLVTGLRNSGVDNLQVYRAVIVDPATGVRREDYRVVNIVGRVAVADLQESVWAAPGEPIIDVDFDSLAIDEAGATGLLLFRLAECISAIVVHARVREALIAAGFHSLTFLDPKEYVG